MGNHIHSTIWHHWGSIRSGSKICLYCCKDFNTLIFHYVGGRLISWNVRLNKFNHTETTTTTDIMNSKKRGKNCINILLQNSNRVFKHIFIHFSDLSHLLPSQKPVFKGVSCLPILVCHSSIYKQWKCLSLWRLRMIFKVSFFVIVRGHSITTWTRWGGRGSKYVCFFHSQDIKTVHAGGGDGG